MLNKFILSCNWSAKALSAFMIIGLLISLNCGKRKPPLPPIEKITQRTEVSGTQRGNVITLTWMLPAENAPEKSLLNISRADVYRLNEPANSPLTLSEEEFASRGNLISSVRVTDDDFRLGRMKFTDSLEFAGQNARLRYALRFVNSSGQKGSFSNFLLIEPTVRVANSPNSLLARVSEKAIILEWNAPTENVDGSKPANILGYNIYRSGNDSDAERILNPQPITGEGFRDESFTFGNDYRYFMRAISLGGNGSPIESADSNSVEVRPRDIFPPMAPDAITIAAAPNNLSIFFAVNPEKDVVGYRIYRSNDRNKPVSEWSLLTPELLTTNTFQDKGVMSNTTYFYFLTAVDKTGNVSQASAIVSETAP